MMRTRFGSLCDPLLADDPDDLSSSETVFQARLALWLFVFMVLCVCARCIAFCKAKHHGKPFLAACVFTGCTLLCEGLDDSQ